MILDLNAFDPILRETVERSLEPYKKKLSPEQIDRFREEALVLLSSHPYPAALLQQLRRSDQPEVQHSTANPKDDATTPPGSVKSGGGR